jgi:Carboxypeptidase regulatory-like domain
MIRVLAVMILCGLSVVSGLSQSNTGRLLGAVSGPDGVIAGATVLVTDAKTGRAKTVTTTSEGTFTVPQLDVGAYTVKVTAQSFKAYIANDVKIDVGQEYVLNVGLEVGSIEESVTVTAGADVLNAATGELATTVNPKQILELPLNGRNPLNLIALQAGTSQNGAQGTTINGVRTSFTNITRDGINVQDAFIRSNATDFVPERPSVDDTGEFTINTANAGADQGYGSAQVRLVTPRGQKDIHGNLFFYNRNSALAANDFFRNRAGLPVPFLNRNQFGGSVSGPLPIPQFGEGGAATLKDKGFFFFYYEGLRQREQSLRERTILLPDARNGLFTWVDNAGVRRTANIFSLLPAGQPGTVPTAIDPTIRTRFLDRIPTAGNRVDIGDQLNTTGFSFNQPFNQERNSYSTRLDYDVNERNQLHGIYTYKREKLLRPDVDGGNGFGAIPVVEQPLITKTMSLAYRMIPAATFTNEIRGGFSRYLASFDRTVAPPSNFVIPTLISNPDVTFLDQGRRAGNWAIMDNAEWNIRTHALRFGGIGQFFFADPYNDAGIVRTFNLGVNPNTPQLAVAQFAALGGISPTQLNTANNLLALLGGIVSTATQNFNVADRNSGFQPVRRLEDFVYNNIAFYIQDQWRVKSTLTLNLGVRYEMYSGVRLKNGLLIEPVIPNGTNPVDAVLNSNGTYNFLGANSGGDNRLYRNDNNNWAPVLSFAWSPGSSKGMMKSLFGEGQTVIRGGYRMSYGNDAAITATRNALNNNVGLGTTGINAVNSATNTAQLNARVSALGAINIATPTVQVPRTFAQNNTAAFGNFGTVFAVDPNLQTPRVTEYSFGIQRQFGKNAFEIRYVGTRADNFIRSIDYNQVDIRGNGFLADFNRARANLVLTGNPACTAAQNPGCQALTVFPNLAAGGLLANPAIRNQLTLGQPADLALLYVTNALAGTVKFLPNANTGVANVLENGSLLRYNSLQTEFRRRVSSGLNFQANYTFSKALTNAISTGQTLVDPFLDNRQPGLEYARADYDQTHVFNLNTIYDLPFGAGRKFFNGANRAVDRVIGGWQLTTIVRVGTGSPLSIIDPRGTLNRAGRSARQTAFSNLTKDQIKNLVGIRKLSGGVFFIDPAVININSDGTTGGQRTGRASEGFGTTAFAGQSFFNVAPGLTGNLERAVFNGPIIANVDFSVLKTIRFTERIRFQLRAETFNVFNRANFGFNATEQFGAFNINSTNFGRVVRTVTDPRIIQIAGRIEF